MTIQIESLLPGIAAQRPVIGDRTIEKIAVNLQFTPKDGAASDAKPGFETREEAEQSLRPYFYMLTRAAIADAGEREFLEIAVMRDTEIWLDQKEAGARPWFIVVKYARCHSTRT